MDARENGIEYSEDLLTDGHKFYLAYLDSGTRKDPKK